MTNFKSFKILLSAGIVAITSSAAFAMNPEVGGAPMFAEKNIVENAVNSKDHTTLVAAVKAAGLVETLMSPGPFTVFAPTNDAFAKIDSETLNSLLKEENRNSLTNILTYHVISGKITATDVVAALKKGKGTVELKALNEQGLTVMEKDGKIWLKDSNGNISEIIATDVMGSNGVIHVINSVVMPK